MKIAFIGQKGIPVKYGGIEKFVEEVSTRLANMGHQVYVYCRKYYTDSKISIFNGVKIIRVGGIRTKRLDTLSHTFVALMKAIFNKVDLIFLQSFPNSIFLFIPFLFKKTIVNLHGFEWNVKKWNKFDKLLFRLNLIPLKYFSNLIITVNENDRYFLEKKINKKVEYIPNGVNIPKINKREETELLRKFNIRKKKYLLCVGRIVEGKGFEYVIKAFNNFNLKGVKLIIAGNHSSSKKYYDYLRKLANDNNNIIFTGLIDNDLLAIIYKNAYLFILPSESEAFPFVCLEAAINKCPILSSRIESVKSIFKDNIFYFNNKDYRDLNNKLKFVKRNKEIVNEKIDSCYKLVLNNYNWDIIIKSYENIIDQFRYKTKK